MKWSERDDVKNAWDKLASRHSLEKDTSEKATWGFLDFVLGQDYYIVISISKARKFGWTGYVSHSFTFDVPGSELNVRNTNELYSYVDTWDSLTDCLDELEQDKVLPKTK